VLAFAAVWSSSYWVLATNYDAYVVLWGCLLDGDATVRRKYTPRGLLVTSWLFIGSKHY
jgi:hypothetical protein